MARSSISKLRWEELAATARYRADALARLRRITTRQLRRQFHRNFGRPPRRWLTERRIAAAEQLLLAGQSIKAVAFEVGFKQPSHFCRVFKSLRRMTPSEFVGFQSDPLRCSEENNGLRERTRRIA